MKTLIRFYQYKISPHFPSRCKYHPSCSSYAITCFENYNFVKAFVKTLWRLLRCNPLSDGGVDFP